MCIRDRIDVVTLGSFSVPVFIFSCIIHSGGYDPIWCCLFEPQMLKKCIHSHKVPTFPSNSKISQKNSQLFYEIRCNSQISQKIPSDSKKFFGISWNVLDFSVWFSFNLEFLRIPGNSQSLFFNLGIPRNSKFQFTLKNHTFHS